MRKYILGESNWKQISQQEIELAILPWGATEAHNYHLPYSSDNIESDLIAAEAGRIAWEKGAKIIILPTIPYGVNTGQPDIKLDINLNPSTQAAILTDIIEVLNRQKIYKLLILNSHGGNDFKQILRELGLEFPDMFLAACNWFTAVDEKDYFDNIGDHAGEMETSVMLHLAPNLVRPLEEAGSGKSKKIKIKGIAEGWAWTERKWSQVTDDTGIGDPSKATKEKGENYLKAVTEKVANLFVQISDTDINELYE